MSDEPSQKDEANKKMVNHMLHLHCQALARAALLEFLVKDLYTETGKLDRLRAAIAELRKDTEVMTAIAKDSPMLQAAFEEALDRIELSLPNPSGMQH